MLICENKKKINDNIWNEFLFYAYNSLSQLAVKHPLMSSSSQDPNLDVYEKKKTPKL